MRFTKALLVGAALPAMSVASAYYPRQASVGAGAGVTTTPIDLSSFVGGILQTVVGLVNEVLTLIPPPNGQAVANTTLALPAIEIGVANLIRLKLNVTVGVNPDGTLLGLKRRQTANSTDCTLGLLLDGTPLLNISLTDNGGTPQEYTTNQVPGSSSSLLSVVETCGGTPVNINLANLLLLASPMSNSTSSSSSSTKTTSATTKAANTGSASTGGGNGGAASSTTAAATGGNVGSGGNGVSASASASASFTVPPLGEPTNHLVVNSFNFYACVGSSGEFPTFTHAGTSDVMDIEMCTALCLGSPYAGLHDTDCYCGQTIDGAITAKVDNGNCDIPCPGDHTEVCGGDLDVTVGTSRRLSRRQAITDPTILLSIFVNPVNAGVVTSVSTYTTVVPSGTLVVTSTVTPAASASAAASSGAIAPGWIFEGFPGSDCGGEIVFVPGNCTCHGGWGYVPQTCTDDSCNGTTVYKPQRCSPTGSTGTTGVPTAGQPVFTPSQCDTCAGGITWTQSPLQPPVVAVPGGGNATAVPPVTPGTTTPGVVVVAGSSRVIAGVSTLAAALSLLVALL